MRTASESRKSWTLAVGVAALMGLSPLRSEAPASGSDRSAIQREKVASSSITSIGYSPAAKVLEIEFRTGEVYRYRAVPPTVFTALKSAASKGRYFTKHIRNRYEFTRLGGKSP